MVYITCEPIHTAFHFPILFSVFINILKHVEKFVNVSDDQRSDRTDTKNRRP